MCIHDLQEKKDDKEKEDKKESEATGGGGGGKGKFKLKAPKFLRSRSKSRDGAKVRKTKEMRTSKGRKGSPMLGCLGSDLGQLADVCS